MEPLHIVHSEASCGWGGEELRVLTEAHGFVKKGHHVSLLCSSYSHVYKEASKRNMNVYHFPLSKKRLKTIVALRKWLQQNKVDVINTHGSRDSWIMALAVRSLRSGPPIVRTRHVSIPVHNYFYNRWLYTKATQYIVTTGEAIKKRMVDRNGFQADRITSVPTGIDADIFVPGNDSLAIRKKLNLPLDKVIIGIVSKIRNSKGHEYLLPAFAAMQDQNCHLLIVGGSDANKNTTEVLVKQIETLKLGNQVTMTGFQSNVVPYMQAMDLFVLPSYGGEGVPQSITQAMMCELPVITTTAGCIEEAMVHGQTGLLIPPKDSMALKQAIKTLVKNKALRQQYGKAGRVRAKEHFCFHKMISAMEDVFYKAASSSCSLNSL